MAAFGAALRAGFGMELDVRLLADGRVVVFHDDSLDRMCGQSGRIEDYRSEDLDRLRLAGTNERPPLLSELLELVAGRTGLYIEIKNTSKPGALEDAVLAETARYGGPFVLASFNWESLAYVRRRAPGVTRGLIAAPGSTGRWPGSWVWAAWRARPHFVSLGLCLLRGGLWAWARLSGKPVLTWTVRSPEQAAMARLYADNMVFEGFLP